MERSFLIQESVEEARSERLPALGTEDLPTTPSCLRSWRLLDGKFRFILDTDGGILASEDSFFDPEFGGRDFQRVQSRMRPADGRFVTRFVDLLRSTGPGTALIPKSADGGHWICRAIPIVPGSRQAQLGSSRPRIALNIHGTDATARAQWADFRGAFGLTETEERVLKLMLGGKPVAAIAKREAVSVNTVRTHVRHIHEKLAVSEAYELCRRVMDYRLL